MFDIIAGYLLINKWILNNGRGRNDFLLLCLKREKINLIKKREKLFFVFKTLKMKT